MFDSIRDKSIMDFGLKKWWTHCYMFEKYILHKKIFIFCLYSHWPCKQIMLLLKIIAFFQIPCEIFVVENLNKTPPILCRSCMNVASVRNTRKQCTHIVTFNLTFICLQITTNLRKSHNYTLKQAETVMDKFNLSLQI